MKKGRNKNLNTRAERKRSQKRNTRPVRRNGVVIDFWEINEDTDQDAYSFLTLEGYLELNRIIFDR